MPYIGLDRFNILASVFLLTHCHADHLVGLLNKSFSGQVYCSKETKLLLETLFPDHSVLRLVNEVPYNCRTRVELPLDIKKRVYITLIKAYHCTGACMILVEEHSENNSSSSFTESIEDTTTAVLCTGDIRAEKWWTDTLTNVPHLFPYLSGLKALDNIYFDSSFAYRGEPYLELPPNNLGIFSCITLLKKYPVDSDIRFDFSDTTLGFDHAWAFVASYFRAGLKVADKKLAAKLAVVAKYDEYNGKLLRAAFRRAGCEGKRQFNVGRSIRPQQTTSSAVVRLRQCVDFNIMDLVGACFPIPVKTIPDGEPMKLTQETKQGSKVYEFRGRSWVLLADETELLPLDIKLIFSRHSSFTEVMYFLSRFKPKQVFPCSYTQKAWMNGFVMSRLFGKICSSETFFFDEMMYLKYGNPVKEVLDRLVACIDRWNVADCEEEVKFVNNLVSEATIANTDPKLALINIRKVVRTPAFMKHRTLADQQFLEETKSAHALQKISEGRRDVTYQKFIEEQQMLYYKKHNLPQYERDYESAKYKRSFLSTLGGSSDYDSESCDSSLDLERLATRRLDRKEGECKSESDRKSDSESPTECPQNNRRQSASKHGPVHMQLSHVESSFASWEESIRKRPAYCRQRSSSVIYRPDGRVNVKIIQLLSRKLAQRPSLWGKYQLQSTAKK